MAKLELSRLLEGVRGRVGSLVFRRCGRGTVVQRAPNMTGLPASPAQRAQRERFRRAVEYGRAVRADPALRALYGERARARGTNTMALCVAEHLNGPAAEERSGRPGGSREDGRSRPSTRNAAPVAGSRSLRRISSGFRAFGFRISRGRTFFVGTPRGWR